MKLLVPIGVYFGLLAISAMRVFSLLGFLITTETGPSRCSRSRSPARGWR